MNIQATSVEDYLAKTGDYEPALRQLDEIIQTSAPHLERKLFGNMGNGVAVGYGLMPYQSKSMKEPGQWPLIGLAAQKNYMALYICAIIDGVYVAERHEKELGKVNIGRSCIRFKKFEDLNLVTVRKILTDLDTRFASGETLFP
ncbi:MAG: DUF1801 domain-containing protein [Candidatus Saccharimonadales bacterium]